jgi:putative serine protease PepD
MSTAYDPYGMPQPRQQPMDPLLSHPDHPSGVWSTPANWPEPADLPEWDAPSDRSPQRIGHPRPARGVAPHRPAPLGSGEYPVVAVPGAEPAVLNGRGRTRLFTILIVLVLVLVAGWQAYRLDRIGTNNDRLAAVVSAERDKSAKLTDRTVQLEKQAAGVFDPEAISSAVLPSVFRVRAGDLTGTAFSIGDKAAKGQANLLTNYHVVQTVYEQGNRKVFLERGADELTATIVKVNKGKDLALLRATKEIKGLTAGSLTVKPGQQIVVVGAPLGLEDTVTTGVVSAYRQEDTGPTIQFDAPINPGNSGGPVVSSTDQVLGLATSKAENAEGIGLAIPIKTACDAFTDIC